MKFCLHCREVRDFIKRFIEKRTYYQLICTTCDRVTWVGKTV